MELLAEPVAASMKRGVTQPLVVVAAAVTMVKVPLTQAAHRCSAALVVAPAGH